MAAEQEGSDFVQDRASAWTEILYIQEERIVGNDNTVKWHRLCLQLPSNRLRPHFVKATVRVHEYPDGTIVVFLGPHRLADYDSAGEMTEILEQERSGQITSYQNRTSLQASASRLSNTRGPSL